MDLTTRFGADVMEDQLVMDVQQKHLPASTAHRITRTTQVFASVGTELVLGASASIRKQDINAHLKKSINRWVSE